MRTFLALALFACLLPSAAGAQQLNFTPVVKAIAAEEQTQAPPPPFVYSDGYHTRLKIHKIASFTFLPLVATQGVLGKMVYDHPTPERRQWHRRTAWAIGGLFAVNTVTGAWNLIEARKDPNHRKRRLAHGLLMLASDAGFLATALTNPTHNGLDDPLHQRSLHRGLAVASISTATVGYLLMLFK